jgi:tetratricopeptide (TPR) repeat protein
MTQSQPPTTGTIHTLPFDKLSPRDFERLCLWLVQREGYKRAEHLGLAGREQGRDVVAYKPTPHGEGLWYFQCKRYRSINARTLKDEVDKYLRLVQEKPHLQPVGAVFVVSCAVSAGVREEVGDYCEQHGLAHEFLALTELDEKVKRHPDIVEEFFGSPIRKVFQSVVNVVVSPWGLAILAVAVVLAAGIFNIPTLQGLLPTPTPFDPASEDESLIIVADFDDRSSGKYQGVDPAQYIYERLVAKVERDGLDVRIERLRQVVDDNTAKPTGEAYNATLVLWGWYDALAITPRMERIRTVTTYRSTEEGQHLSLVDPEKVEFSIVAELPIQATYVTLLTLGVDKFTGGSMDQALAYFNSALASLSSLPDFEETIGIHFIVFRKPPSEALFFRGNCYYVLGNYSEAAKDYEEAIESNPNFASAHVNLGNLYLLEYDYEHASDEYKRAIEIEPNSAIAYINLALLEAIEGNLSRALELVTIAISLNDSDQMFAYGARGAIYAQAGQWEQAAKDLTRAIEQDETFALAYTNRGLAYRELGYLDQAIADLERAIELDSSIAEAYYNRASIYMAKGDYLSAITDLTKTIELEPEGIGDVPGLIVVAYYIDDVSAEVNRLRTQSRNSARLAEVYHTRGEAHASLGRIEEARNDYLKAAEIYAQLAKASRVKVCAGAAGGSIASPLTELSSLDKAIMNYTSLIEIDPVRTDAYYGRGIAYYHLSKPEQAVVDLSTAIDLEPDKADAYLVRGLAYAEMGEHERAITDFTKAIRIKPDLAAAYNNRAGVYEQVGSYEQAIADYSRVVEIDKNLPEVYLNRGFLYERLGSKDLAIADFERVLEFPPCSGGNYERWYYGQAEQHLKELKGE